MERKRVHVWIAGRVQGVYFRAFTRDAAQREGVSGWVRNLSDGRVEAVFEGDADGVDRMVEWCRTGSHGSRVREVTVMEEPVRGETGAFRITHGG